MKGLGWRDATSLLDAVYELGLVRTMEALPLVVARLAFGLIACDRSGWMVMDLARGRVEGVHWPHNITQLLQLMPPDLREVPLVMPLLESGSASAMSIDDVLSRRQWHSSAIYSELYGPQGVEYQLVAPLSLIRSDGRGSAPRLEALSFVRHDHPFSDRDRAMLDEFSRHVRSAARRLRGPTPPFEREAALQLGLTGRQTDALLAIADGATMARAAHRLGVTPKTLENHLQAAYARLDVNNRVAAFATLRQRDSSRFALGEIPH